MKNVMLLLFFATITCVAQAQLTFKVEKVDASAVPQAVLDAQAQLAYFNRINAMQLKNPRLIGFGISNHDTFVTACKYASGAIIGSAFIKVLANSDDAEQTTVKFVKKIAGEMTV